MTEVILAASALIVLISLRNSIVLGIVRRDLSRGTQNPYYLGRFAVAWGILGVLFSIVGLAAIVWLYLFIVRGK